MAHRTTLKDLERLVERVAAYSATLGIISPDRGERLGLDQGSATYGRAWRIFSTGLDGNTGHSDPFGLSSGYLGWSKAEAWLSLRALEAGLWKAIICLERTLQDIEAKAEAEAERYTANHPAWLKVGKAKSAGLYRVSAYASVDVTADSEAQAVEIAHDLIALGDIKPRDFDLIAEATEPDSVSEIDLDRPII